MIYLKGKGVISKWYYKGTDELYRGRFYQMPHLEKLTLLKELYDHQITNYHIGNIFYKHGSMEFNI